MAKTKKQIREHNPINWKAVFRMATAKKSNGSPRYSITEMAQKLGYYNKQSNDPTQEFRGMLSRARTIGIRIGDKLTKLPKATVRRGGKPVARLTKAKAAVKVAKAKAPKPQKMVKAAKKVAAPKPKVAVKAAKAPKVSKVAVKKVAKVAGKQTVAIQQHESGRVVSVKIGDKEALVPKGQMVPQLTNLAHEMGFDLVPHKPEQAAQVAEAPAPKEQAVEAPKAETSQATATETPAPKAEEPKAENHQAA